MNVTIIVIGDELLVGQVTDTNSGFLSRQLDPHGWHVDQVITIADKERDIVDALDCGLSRSDVVLTTGGLGPTNDDITKRTLCKYFGGKMLLDEATLKNVESIMNRRGLALNELTRGQAVVPDNCKVIQNRVGTAPLMWWDLDDRGKTVVAMPGVPFETREMFTSEVLPRLLRRYPTETEYKHRNLMICGISESALAEKIAKIEESLPSQIHIAYLPKPGLLRLRFDACGRRGEALDEMLDKAVDDVARCVGEDLILSRHDSTIGEIIKELMSGSGKTLSTAESCTGGNIAHTITAVAGSSEYFIGSIVSYANSVKTNVLGVDEQKIAHYGVVSEPVVKEMAEGARRALGTDYAVATSGIAGPGGATPGKPVGTVCMAVAGPAGTRTWTAHLPGDRARVIDRATTDVLIALARGLNGDTR